MSVRTRFAPSPTGRLHIGNARTALFNRLFARRYNGSFIVRIEDTDIERSTREFEKNILEDLLWLGLDWDEGPDVGGAKGPYRQSERLSIYKSYAARLVDAGLAYNCYCSKERLEEVRKTQLAKGLPPRYDGRCRIMTPSEAPAGAAPAIRFRVPEREIKVIDGVHGELSFETSAFGDFVIVGSDGAASYSFAVVVDDALMEITHVIRGDDHLSNTPRQILLFDALGLRAPSFSHIPLVLGPNKLPLSKRERNASVGELRDDGYLPGAIVNAIARLGWSPEEGLFGLDDLSSNFALESLSNSPAVFDVERLKSFNREAIKKMDASALFASLGMGERDVLFKEAVLEIRANASTISELKDIIDSVTGGIGYDEAALAVLNEPYAKEALRAFSDEAARFDLLDGPAYNKIIGEVKKKTGEKGPRLFHPIRYALTGKKEGIELVNVLKLVGRIEALKRIKSFI
ncbi:MAG: glutamate--tRNA ligase [Deltaproteobacteria bacterium]|nr:glutamate--tRNA ligase [Deltaproteobacteria bacterium]